jgi:rhodanese-related sulfurtransferase
MGVSHVPVTEAFVMQQAGATIIDVRSSREFADGHAAGAVNVPLLEHDEESGQMLANPDFVRVMQVNFPADATLLLSCRSGSRSARAARMLETFGFTALVNVLGGFAGSQHPVDGRVVDAGWHSAGLPVSMDVTRSYAELLAAADAADDAGR